MLFLSKNLKTLEETKNLEILTTNFGVPGLGCTESLKILLIESGLNAVLDAMTWKF